MKNSEAIRARWILGGLALFAMAWAVARASFQSITVDEAVTYNIFVFNRRFLWFAANNHILNSALMYGFTRLLGLSPLTARLPALLGAAFYITAAYRLCRLLGASLLVQLTAVRVPGIQSVHLRLSCRRTRIRSGAGLSDVGRRVFRRSARRANLSAGGVCRIFAVRRIIGGCELFFRLRESGGDDRDTRLRLAPAPEGLAPPDGRLRPARRGRIRHRFRVCLVTYASRRADLWRHEPG